MISPSDFEFVFTRGEVADPKQAYPYNTRHFDEPHRMLANKEGSTIGHVSWSPREDGSITDVFVEASYRRQGIASELFKRATHLSSQFSDVPTPVHNSRRTASGDAWAKAVGGNIPELEPYERSGGIWG